MVMHVAFYRGRGDIIDKIIRLWTRGKYSHCELVFELVTDGPSLCISSSARDGGVRSKRIMLDDDWDVIPVAADNAPAWAWAANHANEAYDYLGVIGLALNKGMQDQNKWFCSEAAAAMLGYKKPWSFNPSTLYYFILNGKSK